MLRLNRLHCGTSNLIYNQECHKSGEENGQEQSKSVAEVTWLVTESKKKEKCFAPTHHTLAILC